eukprot:CAMPEP_0197564970 /NCGR_PEP_ID=MMETSP1320-20131121/31333_1 /TAXON_ID=91990 /ORGANISM="Bolidomonas sp., Strain RCC2347" /LENGTH=131 /DNA_ID=CAMNT_0043126917 /DNA_START=164 /DNA_END=559 /DNA_ORIENTATION=-
MSTSCLAFLRRAELHTPRANDGSKRRIEDRDFEGRTLVFATRPSWGRERRGEEEGRPRGVRTQQTPFKSRIIRGFTRYEAQEEDVAVVVVVVVVVAEAKACASQLRVTSCDDKAAAGSDVGRATAFDVTLA